MKLSVSSALATILVSAHALQTSQLMGNPQTASTRSVQSSTALQMEAASDAPPLKRNPPRRICLMVEPTPFTHVSGYANRFNEMLRFMKKAGDDVEIVTVDSKTPAKDLPSEAFGYRISHTQGFTFPLYNHISLTVDLPEMKGARIMEKFKPDLIHVTSP
jgi:sulfoquinovosyltransferase